MFKGKAGSLKYLQGLGLKVPDWKLITHEEIRSWGDQSLLGDLEAFKKTIKIPQEIVAAFKTQIPLAIRSSASVEDSVGNSFAGIFDTKLLVENDIEQNIIHVWSSLYDPNALKYCQERGVSENELKMDVIIQRMIIGEKSGVLFEADPTGLIHHQLIVAGYGLGQGIVDDLTDTDRFIIASGKILKAHINHKKNSLVQDPLSRQLTQKTVDPSLADAAVLNGSEIEQLIKASKKIGQKLDSFMDIEFTFLNGELYVLQARPITTLPPKSSLYIFDNSNIAENYPGISLPMSFSALKLGYAANFKNLIEFLGFPENERKAIEPKLDQLIGYWGGQIYYNLNHWYAVYGLLPFGSEKAIQSFNDMVGITTDSIIKPPQRSFYEKIKILLTILPRFARYYFKTSNHHKVYKKHFAELQRDVLKEIESADSRIALINLIQESNSRYLSFIKIPLVNDFFSSILNHACRTLAVKMMGPEGESVYNDLLSHQEDLESSKAIYSLIELAEVVSHDSSLKSYLENHKADPLILYKLASPHPSFAQKLKKHFDLYGDRSQWEMKIETPTARENPETTIKLIINYAENKVTVADQRDRERQKSLKARETLKSKQWGHPLKAVLFHLLFKKCTEALCFREDSRFDRVRFKGLSRQMCLGLGALLEKKKVLDEASDIFYLTFDEMLALKHDSYGMDYTKKLVSLRKDQMKNFSELILPDRILVNDVSSVMAFAQKTSHELTNEIQGLPCSGGQVEAECVVVKDLNQAPSLTGKILIAERTDPAWGFFFVGVKGIIIEKGSMLSHAAIISRELGIPCIINVSNATNMFQTGMKLSMNGDTGEIQVIDKKD